MFGPAMAILARGDLNLWVAGAALTYSEAEPLKDWLFEADRPLEIQDFVATEVATDPQDDLVAAYTSLLDGFAGEYGVHGPFWGLPLYMPDREIAALITQGYLVCLDKVEKIGGTHMVMHSPFNHWDTLNRCNYPNSLQMKLDAAMLVLEPVAARARDIGCGLMLENIEDADPTLRHTLCREVGTDVMRLSVDTGHAALAHGQNDAPPVVDFILAAGADLGHVHLQDADGWADRHWHPGEGTLPWGGIFQALREGGGHPRLILEVRDRKMALPQTAAWLETVTAVGAS